jgi:DNA-directed RNA polymerase subunit RPC12/RpoP
MKAKQKPKPKQPAVMAYRVIVPLLTASKYSSQVKTIALRANPNESTATLVFHKSPVADDWPMEKQTLTLYPCVKCGKLDEFLWDPGCLCPKCLNPKLTIFMKLKTWWRKKFPRARAKLKREAFDFQDVGQKWLSPPSDIDDRN